MAKVIIVKYLGSGKYKAIAEGAKPCTVSDLDESVIPLEKQGCNPSEIAEIVAFHYWENVLQWGTVGYTLHQGQMPNNDFIHVLAKNLVKI